MTDISDLLNSIAEWQQIVQKLREAMEGINMVRRVHPLRPDCRRAVKIDTKGHQRKPCGVARSMRRVGRK